MSDSPVEKTAAAVVSADGKDGAAIQPVQGGGAVLSPLPLSGGRRKTRRVSKKVLKMLKKMGPAKVAKMLKGGEAAPIEGGRRRKSRKGSRRH